MSDRRELWYMIGCAVLLIACAVMVIVSVAVALTRIPCVCP